MCDRLQGLYYTDKRGKNTVVNEALTLLHFFPLMSLTCEVDGKCVYEWVVANRLRDDAAAAAARNNLCRLCPINTS